MLDKLRADKIQAMIVVGCVAIITLFLTGIGVFLPKAVEEAKNVDIVIPQLKIAETSHEVPHGQYIMSEEEFEELKEEDNVATFQTYEEYVVNAGYSSSTASFSDQNNSASFEDSSSSVTADGANKMLYDYCDKYFNVFYGTTRISPIFPMAIANAETCGRADPNITWSSLFPSKYVDVSLMDKFDVTYIAKDPVKYDALMHEYSTRDRGALQMSPTYGTGSKNIASVMSGTEKEKLSKIDTSKCAMWASGASSYPGDRFYLPDILLRLQVAMNSTLSSMYVNNWSPDSDLQLLAMMAISHNSGSGVWSTSSHSSKIGNWKSAQRCYDWCKIVSKPEVISKVVAYAEQSNSTSISKDTAAKLLSSVNPDANYSDYTTSSINAYYPIVVLYAYIKLGMLYTQ